MVFFLGVGVYDVEVRLLKGVLDFECGNVCVLLEWVFLIEIVFDEFG